MLRSFWLSRSRYRLRVLPFRVGECLLRTMSQEMRSTQTASQPFLSSTKLYIAFVYFYHFSTCHSVSSASCRLFVKCRYTPGFLNRHNCLGINTACTATECVRSNHQGGNNVTTTPSTNDEEMNNLSTVRNSFEEIHLDTLIQILYRVVCLSHSSMPYQAASQAPQPFPLQSSPLPPSYVQTQ